MLPPQSRARGRCLCPAIVAFLVASVAVSAAAFDSLSPPSPLPLPPRRRHGRRRQDRRRRCFRRETPASCCRRRLAIVATAIVAFLVASVVVSAAAFDSLSPPSPLTLPPRRRHVYPTI